MKRIVTTLGNLKEGDKFYFPADKQRKAYVCLGWERPYQHAPQRKWSMKYAPSGRKITSALIEHGIGNREVVKLEEMLQEHADQESSPAQDS